MRFIAKTLFGLENVLADELTSIGAGNVRPVNRAVTFDGDEHLLYKANYTLRTAITILWQIGEFNIKTSEDLYKAGSAIRWEDFFTSSQTFSVVPVVNSTIFRHTGYAGLVLKDAIADRFRNSMGRRPSVSTTDPDIIINLHIDRGRVNVSLDSSGVPLFKRGYRKESALAPLNEVLAAGILKLSGWNPEFSLLDPMCGSGTIPIEACLMALKIPPGSFRQGYGFQRWTNYDRGKFEAVKNECNASSTERKIQIIASDISAEATAKSITNVRYAGLSDYISVENVDFRDRKSSSDEGFIIMNPPYGQRIKETDLTGLYNMIGSTFKHRFPGHTAFIITSEKEALKHVGLKPSGKFILYNGALECLLVRYLLYKGSLRK